MSPADPRPRNAEATRSAILDAAVGRFAHNGYDGASLRDIAAAVGVDAALVNRYFGSKDELFAEVLACTSGPAAIMAAGHESFGENVARLLFDEPQDGRKLDNLLIMLRSAGSPRALEIIHRSHRERFGDPFVSWIGTPDAAVRARLILSIILGFAVSRVLSDENLLQGNERAELRSRLASLLQDCLDR